VGKRPWQADFALALIVGSWRSRSQPVVAHSLALLSDAGHMLADRRRSDFRCLRCGFAARPAAGRDDVRLGAAEILSPGEWVRC